MNPLHLLSKYAICYLIFFLLTYMSKLNEGNRLFDQNGPTRNTGILLGFQLAGILWLGIIPFFILHYPLFDIITGRHSPGILQVSCIIILVSAAVTCGINEGYKTNLQSLSSRKEDLFTARFIYRYIVYRTIFLISYETFFRGYLLNDAIRFYGVLPGILLNIFLYTLLHVVNSRKEILVCVFFGTILCMLCIWCGAAWPAIIIHVVFTITYELKMIQKIKGNKKN